MDTPTVTSWTWDPGSAQSNRCGVADLAYFRVETQLEGAVTDPVLLRLTADSRYRLMVNGELVGAGPAKPSGGVWFVDTVDIAGHLRVGQNVVGIEVLTYSVDKTGNASVLRTGSPGLSVTGLLPNGVDLSDPAAWRWIPVQRPHVQRQGLNTVFLGIQEDTDGRPAAARLAVRRVSTTQDGPYRQTPVTDGPFLDRDGTAQNAGPHNPVADPGPDPVLGRPSEANG